MREGREERGEGGGVEGGVEEGEVRSMTSCGFIYSPAYLRIDLEAHPQSQLLH